MAVTSPGNSGPRDVGQIGSEAWHRALFQHATDLVIVLNGDGSRRFVSPSVQRILGYEMSVYLDLSTFELVHPDDLESVRASHLRCLESPGPQDPFRYRVRHQSGDWRVFEGARNNLLHDPDVRGIVITTRDITESELASNRLTQSENQFRSAFANAAIGMALLELDGRWKTVNPVLCDITGYGQTELQSTSINAITISADRDNDCDAIQELLLGTIDSYQREKRFVRPNGNIAWVLMSVSLVRDSELMPLHFIAQIQEITNRKAAEQTLRDSEARFRALLAQAADIVLLLDDRGRVRWASPSVARLLGLDPGSLVGRSNLELVHPGDRGVLRRAYVDTVRAAGEPHRATVRFRHADGTFRWLESVGSNHLDDAAIAGVVINARDVSDRMQLEERLRKESLTDALTGLANRVKFDQQLEHNLAAARRYCSPTGVVFIDLNGFKPINDSLGHAAGDQVLMAVGRRLQSNLRPTDLVARIGGDEFAIALDRLTIHEDIALVIERLEAVFAIPIPIGGNMVSVGASIGWAVSENGLDDPEALLARADHAMYSQKRTITQSLQPTR